eukprot:2627782-Pleurochrysis_carterae.AAC.1
MAHRVLVDRGVHFAHEDPLERLTPASRPRHKQLRKLTAPQAASGSAATNATSSELRKGPAAAWSVHRARAWSSP